ncbi:flippase [Photobacterium profundum]|uniref:flippase n=1 Tax=Photobacterium profundum TaxID=74109 RepID=UPI003D11CF1A
MAKQMLNKGLLKYISNTSWLMAEKIYRLGFGLLITVWMARYLGPEQFGTFSFSLSFVTLFSVLVSLGLENLVVREILNRPKEEASILASALLMRLLGGVFLFGFSALFITQIRPNEPSILVLVMIFSFGFFFKSFEVLRYWFEAHVKAKYSAALEAVAITASVIVKASLILMEAPLTYFAWTIAVETIVMASGLLILYRRQGNAIKNLKPKLDKMRDLLVEAWPLILAGTLYTIYSKIDQIMLGKMVGSEAVGVYAAAVKFSEGWFFIPAVIATSLFPLMLNARKKNKEIYLERTQHLLNLMVVIGVLAALGISGIAHPLIMLAFGSAYEDAALILIVHIWGGVFLAMSGISYRYFIAEGLQKYSFYRGLTGVVVNVLLNIWLIPLYGAMGAAIATVVSQFMALYLFNATNRKTRGMFNMQTRALFLIGVPRTIKHIMLLTRNK